MVCEAVYGYGVMGMKGGVDNSKVAHFTIGACSACLSALSGKGSSASPLGVVSIIRATIESCQLPQHTFTWFLISPASVYVLSIR